MNADSNAPSPAKFILAVFFATALAVGATALLGFNLSAPPRGFMFWTLLGFVCSVEFLAGVWTVNAFARARCQYRPSGATLAATYGIVAAFAATGILGILLYWLFRDDQGSRDPAFAAAMFAVGAAWFVLAFLLYAHDLRVQGVARPALDKRAEHLSLSHSLKASLARLRSLAPPSADLRKRAELLAKKLETAQSSLSHSHGGGIGSWEAGRANPANPEMDLRIRAAVESIDSALAPIPSGDDPAFAPALAELERHAATLSAAVAALGL